MQVDGTIKIFFDDLKEDVQKELLKYWDGDNGNYDVFPMIELPINADEEGVI